MRVNVTLVVSPTVYAATVHEDEREFATGLREVTGSEGFEPSVSGLKVPRLCLIGPEPASYRKCWTDIFPVFSSARAVPHTGDSHLCVRDGLRREQWEPSEVPDWRRPRGRLFVGRTGVAGCSSVERVCAQSSSDSVRTLRVKLTIHEGASDHAGRETFEGIASLHESQAIFQVNETAYVASDDWGSRVTYRTRSTFVRTTVPSEVERAMAQVGPLSSEREPTDAEDRS